MHGAYDAKVNENLKYMSEIRLFLIWLGYLIPEEFCRETHINISYRFLHQSCMGVSAKYYDFLICIPDMRGKSKFWF